MFASRVTFVSVPAVDWELLMELKHFVVAESFCEHRGGSDRGVDAVAADDTLEWDIECRFETVSVDKQ